IHARILEMKTAGCAILLVSVELDEILALSDRIAVINQGRIVGEIPRAEATRDRLGLMMGGGGDTVAGREGLVGSPHAETEGSAA
ncbi:MAG: ABC transporter ATP-binding protein, partial [Pseudomonadota bacterium]